MYLLNKPDMPIQKFSEIFNGFAWQLMTYLVVIGLIFILLEIFKGILKSKFNNRLLNRKFNKGKHSAKMEDDIPVNTKPEGYEDRICPRCGCNLIDRISKHGKFQGSHFWGCSNFPKCRYILNK